MGITRPHHGAAVLKDLHIADIVPRAKFDVLLAPDIHDRADLFHGHLCQSEIMSRREADDPADTILALGNQKPLPFLIVREPWSVELQSRIIILKNIRPRILAGPDP